MAPCVWWRCPAPHAGRLADADLGDGDLEAAFPVSPRSAARKADSAAMPEAATWPASDREVLLDHLEAADRPTELLALRRVAHGLLQDESSAPAICAARAIAP